MPNKNSVNKPKLSQIRTAKSMRSSKKAQKSNKPRSIGVTTKAISKKKSQKLTRNKNYRLQEESKKTKLISIDNDEMIIDGDENDKALIFSGKGKLKTKKISTKKSVQDLLWLSVDDSSSEGVMNVDVEVNGGTTLGGPWF